MDFNLIHPADQIVMFMNMVYRDGLTTTSGGNLSIEDGEGNIWISPSGIDKGTLSRRDIMRVSPEGKAAGPHTPSMELPFHSHVYKIRKDARAVLHAHSPALVAFSLARKIPDTSMMPVLRETCGTPAMAAYAIPGSAKLGDNIAEKFARGYNAVVMENHGACVAAPGMNEAFMLFETLEAAALMELNARKIGKPMPLDEKRLALAGKSKASSMEEFEPGEMTSGERAARRDMVPFVERCCAQRLFGSARGAFSCRTGADSFVITPEGMNRRFMDESRLVSVRGGRREKGKTPSRYAAAHEAIYKAHPDVNAVASAESVYTSAYAVTGAPLDSRTIPESYIQLRDIARVKFDDFFSSPESVAALFSPKVSAALCDNGPLVTVGATMTQAFDRLEVAESTARSLIDARDAGPLVRMGDGEIDEINKAFNLS